ncbi:MAG: DUF3037 domain-containing protein [Chitinophagaceae bacterium]|nr:MAG: DUF3037 domain-containing protein [Chitinophagaceae bacterium]
MSTEKLYYYAIARFVPDLVRNEPRNIGVIVFQEDGPVYEPKFLHNLRSKLGNLLGSADKVILEEYEMYLSGLNPHSYAEFSKILSQVGGKFQFSEIRSGVTGNIELESNYLYSTFVDLPAMPVKRHRLKTTLKQEFKQFGILGDTKVQQDQKIQGEKLEHKIDFSYQNGNLYTIEAVDLSASGKESNTIKTAFKFSDLAHVSKSIRPISVIGDRDDSDPEVKDCVHILSQLSEVYDFSNGGRQKLLLKMKNLVG